ncbi:MAG TPA: hypothetical protein VKM35_10410 [Arenimonas sp.]|uniref:hypothetical protein n=1 Tax=Arenimonas sp. TaxID=1872635 RepID=UPI002C7DDE4F|nr:hypothetical protein [Arenimonas sp.]HMB57609.1 hypothetical protein [Arenimonas sp.]
MSTEKKSPFSDLGLKVISGYRPGWLILPLSRREAMLWGMAIYSTIAVVVLGYLLLSCWGDPGALLLALRQTYKPLAGMISLALLPVVFSREASARAMDERELGHQRRAANATAALALIALAVLGPLTLTGPVAAATLNLAAGYLGWAIVMLFQLCLLVFSATQIALAKLA